jgi:hypothetical protein
MKIASVSKMPIRHTRQYLALQWRIMKTQNISGAARERKGGLTREY